MKLRSIGSPDGSQSRLECQAGLGDPRAGFTLLETLTALAILAIALTALMQTLNTGLRAANNIDDYTQARILAHSLLAEKSRLTKPETGIERGQNGAYRWTIATNPAAASLTPDNPSNIWRLYHLSVTVTWAENRQLQLETLITRARDER